MSQKGKTKSSNSKEFSKASHEKSDLSPSHFDSGTVMSDLDLQFQRSVSVDDDSTDSSTSNWKDSGLHLDSGLDSGLGIESFPSDQDIILGPEVQSKIQIPLGSKLDRKFVYQDEDGDSPLHLAVVHGDANLVFQIMALYPEYLNITNRLSQAALHLAVLLNHARLVRRLIVCGAHVGQCDYLGDTPLHVACRLGRLDCLQALTIPVHQTEVKEAGLPISHPLYRLDPHLLQQRNYDGLTCAHLAAAGSHPVLQYIVQCGADINAKEGKSGKTILHQCVELEHLELVHFLLSVCKAEVNIRNYARRTPLHVAHLQRRYGPKNARLDSVVRLLREYGGEPHDLIGESDDDDSDDEDYE